MSACLIHFENHVVTPLPEETVLDALLRAGINTPFSCKGGSCHTCILQCIEGDIPEKAQRGLSVELRDKGYFLPCRCTPSSSMQLRARQPEDMILKCMLVDVSGHDSGELCINFEVQGNFRHHEGQTLRLQTAPGVEARWSLAAPVSAVSTAYWKREAHQALPDWLAPGAEYGTEFELRGPFNAGFDEVAEKGMPSTDPSLWAELDNGRKARAMLESFYAKVYGDPLLSPFFSRVTMEHAIGKQYNFMEQLITGKAVYWGESMRNTHHWMVISHGLFDHRQGLMKTTMREHGCSEALIRRWTRFEEHFRSDMVKDREWPKRDGDTLINLEGFDSLTLDVGTVCDSCSAEVPSGSTVTYHRRTGQISCPQCQSHAG